MQLFASRLSCLLYTASLIKLSSLHKILDLMLVILMHAINYTDSEALHGQKFKGKDL